jgi:hypothetical protein
LARQASAAMLKKMLNIKLIWLFPPRGCSPDFWIYAQNGQANIQLFMWKIDIKL